MPSPDSPKPARRARPSAVMDRLERSRARIRQRRVAARERERIVTAAVTRYIDEWQAIATCEARRDREIAALRQQAADIESRAAEEISACHSRQAVAAATIREQTHTDHEVAELLEISDKEVRRLIVSARTDGDESGGVAPSDPVPPRSSRREDSMVAPDGVGHSTGL